MRLRKRYVVRAGYRHVNGRRDLLSVERYRTRAKAEAGLAEMKRSYVDSFHRRMDTPGFSLRWDRMIFELEDPDGHWKQSGLRNDEWCV